jgi:hypothetical protein
MKGVRRIHAFELEDQPWMPRIVRESGMAYLRFAAEKLGAAEKMRPLIESILDRSGEKEILDLCSGGAGPLIEVASGLARNGRETSVTLSDRFPDPGAIELAETSGIAGLHYESQPMDALDVPPDRAGLRTLFNAFHHMRPEQAREILASAVRGRRPIAVLEVLQRKPLSLIGMLFSPLLVLLVVPFLRPFRLAWIPLTYLIPIIPLFIVWDGVVSCLRIYDENELLSLASKADPEDSFEWEVKFIPLDPQPVPGIALIGIPRVD